MFNNTFSLSNSSAHFLSNSLALLFIPVLGNFFLDNSAVVHVREIIALLFMLKLTLILGYIISLCFSSLMANLLILSLAFLRVFGVTFLFILSVTFLFIFSFTLLFRNLFSPGNLYCMALFSRLVVNFSVPHSIALIFVLSGTLFIIGSHFMWYLKSITFLSRFIPAFLFPDSITGRNTTVGATNQKQQSQYLHSTCNISLNLPT